MQCLTPLIIYRHEREYDHPTRLKSDVVPCGLCPACLRTRQKGWVFRLKQELKIAHSSQFLTLTYEDEHLPFSNNGLATLKIKDHQNFIKRLRKNIKEHFPEEIKAPIKYYSAGEYGGETDRPHIHSIMFNLPESYIKHPELIIKDWQKGHVQAKAVHGHNIGYTTGYLHKTLYTDGVQEGDDRKKEFSLMSKGLGKNYLSEEMLEYYRKVKTPYLTVESGYKIQMPRYYKNKIYVSESDKYEAQKASERFMEDNPQFKDEKHRHDLVTNEIRKQVKKNLIERKQL